MPNNTDAAVAGQPLSIRAAVWNEVIDFVRAQKDRQLSPAGSGYRPREVLLYNDTGSDIAQFDAVGVGDAEFDPAGDDYADTNHLVLKSGTAATAVAQEPIPNTTIGRIVIAGVTRCHITKASGAAEPTRVVRSSANFVGAGGGYPVVWRNAGTGTNDGVINLSGDNRGLMFPVKLHTPGSGSTGSDGAAPSTYATWKYEGRDWDTDSVVLATNADVVGARPIAAGTTRATHGIGFLDGTGAFVLLWADEKFPLTTVSVVSGVTVSWNTSTHKLHTVCNFKSVTVLSSTDGSDTTGDVQFYDCDGGT